LFTYICLYIIRIRTVEINYTITDNVIQASKQASYDFMKKYFSKIALLTANSNDMS